MIFVTLGTQDKQFTRLLDMVSDYITNNNFKGKVIVQAGYTKYDSDKMEIFDLLDKDDFDKYVSKCDLLITHGGVGSILTGLKHKKKVIACPRLAKYKEHMNDHQIQIIDRFSEAGYIIPLYENDDLTNAIMKVKTFKPNKYVSNTKNMIELIKDYIDNN